jgi:thioredoxin-related protein
MLKKFLSFLIMFILLTSINRAQEKKPLAADEILKVSLKGEKDSNKPLFVIFHASWCGWCKRLEKVIETPGVKEIIDQHFVVVRLDVLEKAEKIDQLENPGAREIMVKYGGEKSGLPFYLLLDNSGKKIADSNALPGNQNIGFPGSEDEFAAFGKFLKKGSKSITADQLALIIETIKSNLPKPVKQ